MGRNPTYSHRLNCRINRKAAERLYEVLDRIGGGRRKPIGRLISLLILQQDDWPKILRHFPPVPPKPREEWTALDLKRAGAERQIREQLRVQRRNPGREDQAS